MFLLMNTGKRIWSFSVIKGKDGKVKLFSLYNVLQLTKGDNLRSTQMLKES